jgi:DNA-binding NtrC family response regulator
LESGELFPLGDREPVTADVRVIAATHRDLPALVQQGLFREDLYYRLYVVPIHVPPLRERPEDIHALASHFLRRLANFQLEPLLTSDALARLQVHPWPGNARELRNVIERTLAFDPSATVIRAASLRFGQNLR